MRKSQASVEFLIVLSAVILIIAMMGFFLYQRYIRGDELKIFVQGVRVVNTISDNVNEINMVGSGYSQYFTLPESLYGNRQYTVVFYKNESTVYLKGGSFVRGIELVWSAPISTNRLGCVIPECNQQCNTSINDICLKVNGTMTLRVTNEDGMVYLTYPYHLRQNQTTWYIRPFVGNFTYDNTSCPRGSSLYIYKNMQDGTTSLVFRHNSSVNNPLAMDLYNITGVLNVTVSDKPGELDLSRTVNEGQWNLDTDRCRGGAITFQEGISLCISSSSMAGGMTWYWLNGDGTTIYLGGPGATQSICLTYP
jgi:hypothetical protein